MRGIRSKNPEGAKGSGLDGLVVLAFFDDLFRRKVVPRRGGDAGH